jgi:hypothetical protein
MKGVPCGRTAGRFFHRLRGESTENVRNYVANATNVRFRP